jgi:hypothetical protein
MVTLETEIMIFLRFYRQIRIMVFLLVSVFQLLTKPSSHPTPSPYAKSL